MCNVITWSVSHVLKETVKVRQSDTAQARDVKQCPPLVIKLSSSATLNYLQQCEETHLETLTVKGVCLFESIITSHTAYTIYIHK